MACVLGPASKLTTARELGERTGSSTLAELLAVESVTADELYAALDGLGERQEALENALARKHGGEGMLLLYDVTSTYFEGRACPLARRGYSRDGKRDKLQLVIGLLCTGEGIPLAVEVFEGNTPDTQTVAAQIAKRVPANTFENKFNLLQQAMGIALRPGQDELTKAVNDFVARNTANGELNKLYQKWLGAPLPKLD